MRRKIVFLTFSLSFTLAALAHRADADFQVCTEGSTRAIRTGTCCTLNRERNEIWVCQDGFWSPTGEYSCSGPCVVF